jgi:hypothetical protein
MLADATLDKLQAKDGFPRHIIDILSGRARRHGLDIIYHTGKPVSKKSKKKNIPLAFAYPNNYFFNVYRLGRSGLSP